MLIEKYNVREELFYPVPVLVVSALGDHVHGGDDRGHRGDDGDHHVHDGDDRGLRGDDVEHHVHAETVRLPLENI